jgi:hypothetical protein
VSFFKIPVLANDCGALYFLFINTLLARWDEGYTDPWLILTDLPPELADTCWYTMRCWIECLFNQ